MSPQLDSTPIPSADDVRRRMNAIRECLGSNLGAEQLAWLDEQVLRVAALPSALPVAVGLASRRLGKAPLRTDASDLRGWSVDQAARVLLMLASFASAPESFPARLDALFRAGEIGEQIALLRGLPLYPLPEKLLATAGEGIRSAMQPIFEAVAHNSPYPAEQFSDPMWNQMVVKALFIGARLAPIQGLDARRNADLARMLVDYAHERWAAGRSVSPELWRCVGPFGERYIDDLMRVFESTHLIERQAAALALSECPAPEALAVLESDPEMWRAIRGGRLTWDSLTPA